jgi:hypothetical protein
MMLLRYPGLANKKAKFGVSQVERSPIKIGVSTDSACYGLAIGCGRGTKNLSAIAGSWFNPGDVFRD